MGTKNDPELGAPSMPYVIYCGPTAPATVQAQTNFAPIINARSAAPQPMGQKYTDWREKLRRIQVQSQSIGSSLLLTLATMSLNTIFFVESDDYETIHSNPELYYLRLSMWHIGAVVGSIVCGANRFIWSTRLVNSVASVFAIAGTIVFLCDLKQYIFVIKFVFGMCYGFVYITLISYIGDNITQSYRGFVACSIAISKSIGELFVLTFTMVSINLVGFDTDYQFPFKYFVGGIIIFYCITSLVLTLRYTPESITRLLQVGHDSEARRILQKIFNEGMETQAMRNEFDERKVMVDEDYGTATSGGWLSIITGGNAWPLLLITCLKLLNVVANTIGWNFFILLAFFNLESNKMAFPVMNISMLVVCLILTMVPKYLADYFGRRWFLLVSGVGCGLTLMPLVLHLTKYVVFSLNTMVVLTFIVYSFALVGIVPVQHIYAAEAFPLAKRNASVAFATCIEYILSCLLLVYFPPVGNTSETLNFVLCTAPLLVFGLTIFLFIKLPETKALSLRQCRAKFNKRAGTPAR